MAPVEPNCAQRLYLRTFLLRKELVVNGKCRKKDKILKTGIAEQSLQLRYVFGTGS
jgi:hypothetical protein